MRKRDQDTMTQEETSIQGTKLKVLNVGSGPKGCRLQGDYDDWEKLRLDINPNNEPDVCADVRKLMDNPEYEKAFDAVFCSHMLEHFNYSDVQIVLKNIHHVLKDDGWLEILVPNILEVMQIVVNEKVDLDHTLYVVNGFGVRVIDALYGLGNTSRVVEFDNEFMGHKYGFSPKTLVQELHKAGFKDIDDYSQPGMGCDIRMVAYKEIRV